MKLHWSPRSPFVRKVMIFAHEVGLTWRDGHPQIAAWYESFARRSSARSTLPVDE
jgi:glutathione S-transferase